MESLDTKKEYSVVAKPVPFSSRRSELTVESTIDLYELVVVRLGFPHNDSVVVHINGIKVPCEHWSRVKPNPGAAVTICYLPTGGGGDGGGKDVIRIVATIVVIAAAGFGGGPLASALGWTATGGASIASGLISLVGTLLITALISPPTGGGSFITPSGGSADSDTRSFSISSGRNRVAKYDVLPQVLGKHKVFATYAAEPFTEIEGDDQFLRMLFTFGHGPMEITELKIGDTLLSDFADVEFEIRQGFDADIPVTLYTNDIKEESIGATLSQAAGFILRTTDVGIDEISIDINFPRGLADFDDEGVRQGRNVVIEAQYKLVTDTVFISLPNFSVTEATGSAVRRSQRVAVANGQYDVRLRRITADTTSSRIIDTSVWSTLRSIKTSDPIVDVENLTKVAIRIRATEQLNGAIDTFSAICHTIAPDWNGVAWVEQTTSNPASLYRLILEGKANGKPVDESRIDLDTLQDWHVDNDAEGREFNNIYDSAGTVFTRLSDVCAVGRASFNIIDGLFSVVRDILQTVPIQMFTPRNSSNFEGSKLFIDQPHALKMQFVNPETNWVQDEIIVYDDSFDETNATIFETLNIIGITSSDQSWKLGRYFLAVGRLRPETFTLEVDLENLVATRGDLVRISHDVPLFGVGHGRVVSFTTGGGGEIETITLDESMVLEALGSYQMEVRLNDGTFQKVTLTAPVVDTELKIFTVTTPIIFSLEVDNLASVYSINVGTVDLIITTISPKEDLSAILTLTNAGPGVHNADTGAIPPFNSQITIAGTIDAVLLLPPLIDGVRSDTYSIAGGTFLPRVLIDLGPVRVRTGAPQPNAYQVQMKENSQTESNWLSLPTVDILATQVLITNVEVGVAYDFRLRFVNFVTSRVSGWIIIDNHLVLGNGQIVPDVQQLRIEDTWLSWSYTGPINTAGFKIKYTPFPATPGDWNTASQIGMALASNTTWDTQSVVAIEGSYSFLVKAIDEDDNESVNPAIVTVNIGQDVGDFTNFFSLDYKALGFPGDIVNGSIDGSDNLVADTKLLVDALFWPNGDLAPFWEPPDSNLFWKSGTIFEQMIYTLEFLPPFPINNRQRRWTIDSTISDGALIEYALKDTSLFWKNGDGNLFWGNDSDLFWTDGTNGPFRPWTGAVRNINRQIYLMRVTTPESETQGLISQLVMNVSGAQFEERVEDFAIGTLGNRLPLSIVYNGINQVGDIAIQGTGSAVVIKVIDKDPVLGPLLQAFDKDNIATSAVVDATIKGF